MSTLTKLELNWPVIRASILDEAALLALYVHVEQETNLVHLAQAGFDSKHAFDLISRWRSNYWMTGSDLTKQTMLSLYPTLAPILAAIRAGHHDLRGALKPVQVPHITARITEVDEMSEELCKCGRPARHRGLCRGAKLKPAPITPALAKAVETTVDAPLAPVLPIPADKPFLVHIDRPGMFFFVETTEMEVYGAAVQQARQLVRSNI